MSSSSVRCSSCPALQ
ncbi:hypothetical protein GCT19_22650 [Paraburkholderia sp. CNPSo 3155]|nr:hypothetical protein [Paraburkholderia atlantica]NUY35658.1 hypothetical protein [Paraburkholderia atlantica]